MTEALSAAPPVLNVPFVRPDLPDYANLAAEMQQACDAGLLTKGPHLAALEAEAAVALAVPEAVGVSSCTIGLALVLRSLAERAVSEHEQPVGGRPLRNEVVMPSFVFLASPAAAVWAGMRPVFVEIDPATWTVDPAAVEAAITPQTLAILACHTFGNPCDEARLEQIAARHKIDLVIDAAHGFGSRIDGRPVGSRGTAQVFSMSPTKLVVAGEGGIVATRDAALAAAVREAREYGNDGHYGCTVAGLNGRLAEISAIMARGSLARLPSVRQARCEAASGYAEVLADVPGVALQHVAPGYESSWKDFSIRVSEAVFGCSRDRLRGHLAAHGIDTRAYYTPPCHEMTAFRPFHEGKPALQQTAALAAECLALPMGRHVTADIAREIAARIGEAAR